MYLLFLLHVIVGTSISDLNLKKSIANFFQISPVAKYYLPNFATSNFTKLHFFKYAMTKIHYNKSRQKVIPKKLKLISVKLILFKVIRKKIEVFELSHKNLIIIFYFK